jgi:hypothetical protein
MHRRHQLVITPSPGAPRPALLVRLEVRRYERLAARR